MLLEDSKKIEQAKKEAREAEEAKNIKEIPIIKEEKGAKIDNRRGYKVFNKNR
jgi:hypothetical protein